MPGTILELKLQLQRWVRTIPTWRFIQFKCIYGLGGEADISPINLNRSEWRRSTNIRTRWYREVGRGLFWIMWPWIFSQKKYNFSENLKRRKSQLQELVGDEKPVFGWSEQPVLGPGAEMTSVFEAKNTRCILDGGDGQSMQLIP